MEEYKYERIEEVSYFDLDSDSDVIVIVILRNNLRNNLLKSVLI